MGLFDSLFGKSKHAPAEKLTPENFDKSVWGAVNALDQWSTPEETKHLVHRILCYLYRNLDVMPRMLIQTRTAEEGRFLLSYWLRQHASILKGRIGKNDLRLVYAYATSDSLAYVSERRSELQGVLPHDGVERVMDYWWLTAEDFRLPGYFLLADDLGETCRMNSTDRAKAAVRTYSVQREATLQKLFKPAPEVARSVLQSSAGFFGVFAGDLPFSAEELREAGVRAVMSSGVEPSILSQE